MIKFPARQKIRRAMIILSFVLLPATFVYISYPIIIRGAYRIRSPFHQLASFGQAVVRMALPRRGLAGNLYSPK
jgi:hypothetical protein